MLKPNRRPAQERVSIRIPTFRIRNSDDGTEVPIYLIRRPNVVRLYPGSLINRIERRKIEATDSLILIMVGDRSSACTPEAFDKFSLRWAFADACSIVLWSSHANLKAAAVVERNLSYRRAVLILTSMADEQKWQELIEDAAPETARLCVLKGQESIGRDELKPGFRRPLRRKCH